MKTLLVSIVLCSATVIAQQTPQPQSNNDALDSYTESVTTIANFYTNLIKDQQGNCIYGDCQNSFGISELTQGGEFRGFYNNGVGSGFSQINTKDGASIIFSNYVFGVGAKTGFILVLGEEDKPYVLIDRDAKQGIGYYPEHQMYGAFNIVDGISQESVGIQPTGEDLGCVGGNCYNGAGVYRYNNNDTYAGYFKNGERHGVGEMWYSKGLTYWGQWENGEPQGHGVLVWSENKYYFGAWNNGYKHGEGIMRFTQDTYQAGTWVNGNFTGENNAQNNNQSNARSNTQSSAVNTTPTTGNSSREVSPLSATDRQIVLACNGDKACLVAAYKEKYKQLNTGTAREVVMQQLADYLVGQDLLIPQKTLGVIMASAGVPLVIDYLPQNLKARLRQEAQGVVVDYQQYINSDETKKAVEAAGGRMIKN